MFWGSSWHLARKIMMFSRMFLLSSTCIYHVTPFNFGLINCILHLKPHLRNCVCMEAKGRSGGTGRTSLRLESLSLEVLHLETIPSSPNRAVDRETKQTFLRCQGWRLLVGLAFLPRIKVCAKSCSLALSFLANSAIALQWFDDGRWQFRWCLVACASHLGPWTELGARWKLVQQLPLPACLRLPPLDSPLLQPPPLQEIETNCYWLGVPDEKQNTTKKGRNQERVKKINQRARKTMWSCPNWMDSSPIDSFAV